MALFRFLGLRKEVSDDGGVDERAGVLRLDVLSDLDSGRIRLAKRVIYWVSSGGRCFGF
jgi:hypothetical protein